MTNRRTSAKLLSAFLGLTLLAAACGDDDDAAQEPDTEAPAPPPPRAMTRVARARPAGTLVLGAEQFPECINPITACANSSWMHWAVDMYVLPKLMTLAPDGRLRPVAAARRRARARRRGRRRQRRPVHRHLHDP